MYLDKFPTVCGKKVHFHLRESKYIDKSHNV
jgi:hypothetical protein